MNKKILKLAVPNIITNITVPLLGMVDTGIAGHLESELYIGAIAVAAILFNFIYWNFSFLRMGTSGFTAQAYGAGDRKEAVSVLLRSLVVAFVAGLLIISLQHFLLQAAFFFIDASLQTQAYVRTYFRIYVWAAPAVLGMYAMSGWFIGMQDARTPMWVSITTNAVNIALSFLFVFVFGMQLEGIALGSALAQLTGFALTLFIWSRKYRHLRGYLSLRFIRQLSGFKPFFRVNGDIFLRSLALVLVTTFFTSASARIGDTVLAVNSLLMQLFLLFSYIMDGFAYAAEALTGRYFGARDYGSLRLLVRRLFLWGAGLAALFTLVYLLFSDDVLRLLTDKTAVLQTAEDFRLWALLFPVAGFAAFLWDGVFVGITASRQMRNSMFAAAAFFFVMYYALIPVWGNNALWTAFIAYLTMRSLMQTAYFLTSDSGRRMANRLSPPRSRAN
ncbi:MAG: MATE family efflux transporter [Tannerellaceae bacterium]|jgi:MATE family multidrug resistance protein|nr:MATE family efflux transporter [Tannerellaceae bacterium]